MIHSFINIVLFESWDGNLTYFSQGPYVSQIRGEELTAYAVGTSINIPGLVTAKSTTLT